MDVCFDECKNGSRPIDVQKYSTRDFGTEQPVESIENHSYRKVSFDPISKILGLKTQLHGRGCEAGKRQ